MKRAFAAKLGPERRGHDATAVAGAARRAIDEKRSPSEDLFKVIPRGSPPCSPKRWKRMVSPMAGAAKTDAELELHVVEVVPTGVFEELDDLLACREGHGRRDGRPGLPASGSGNVDRTGQIGPGGGL